MVPPPPQDNIDLPFVVGLDILETPWRSCDVTVIWDVTSLWWYETRWDGVPHACAAIPLTPPSIIVFGSSQRHYGSITETQTDFLGFPAEGHKWRGGYHYEKWLWYYGPSIGRYRWDMMTSSNGNISAFLALSARSSPVTGEFRSQRPVTRSFDVFFALRPNIHLSKESWGWWFAMPSRSLWRHCNVIKILWTQYRALSLSED